MQKALHILKEHWGYDGFRAPQAKVIATVLEGKDTLVLMPTGGGKSLCFQLPALLLPGLTLVVTPLIALMQDQVLQLKQRGIRAEAIYSGMRKKEVANILDRCICGDIKLLYLSPERLKMDDFLERLPYLSLSLIAVDEAHCISQWGYDFRPAYLEIPALRMRVAQVPVIAVTATATKVVQVDIQEKLQMVKPHLFQKSFARENLSYVVRQAVNKARALLSILKKVGGSTVVYANRRTTTKKVSDWLNKHKVVSDFYHAGLEGGVRKEKQEAWLKGAKRVMVATNAFGMGIDKANVRLVIHMNPPATLEAYYQEAGRAGRDGQRAYAILLYDRADLVGNEEQIKRSFLSVAQLRSLYQLLANFFQVAVGSHEGVSYSMDLEHFVETSDLPLQMVKAGIKQLEGAGLIALDDQFVIPAKLHLHLKGSQLHTFRLENPAADKLLKQLLDSYGVSLFRHWTAISPKRIARLLNLMPETIEKQLQYLSSLGVVGYTPAGGEANFTFLTPRYAADRLPLNPKRLATRKKLLIDKAKCVTRYTQCRDRCRTQLLLAYFGEVTKTPCKVCDHCLGKKREKTAHDQTDRAYASAILALLATEHMPVHALIEKIDSEATVAIGEVVRRMLESGEIAYDEALQLAPKSS